MPINYNDIKLNNFVNHNNTILLINTKNLTVTPQYLKIGSGIKLIKVQFPTGKYEIKLTINIYNCNVLLNIGTNNKNSKLNNYYRYKLLNGLNNFKHIKITEDSLNILIIFDKPSNISKFELFDFKIIKENTSNDALSDIMSDNIIDTINNYNIEPTQNNIMQNDDKNTNNTNNANNTNNELIQFNDKINLNEDFDDNKNVIIDNDINLNSITVEDNFNNQKETLVSELLYEQNNEFDNTNKYEDIPYINPESMINQDMYMKDLTESIKSNNTIDQDIKVEHKVIEHTKNVSARTKMNLIKRRNISKTIQIKQTSLKNIPVNPVITSKFLKNKVNNLIDHVYLINNNENPINIFCAKRYLDNIKLNYELFTIKNYDELVKNNIELSQQNKKIYCHLQVIKNAVLCNYSSILILEDTIIPNKNFEINLPRNENDWNVIYLGINQPPVNLESVTKYIPVYDATGTFAYIIKNNVYNDLIRLFTYNKSIDECMKLIQSRHKCFVYKDYQFIDKNLDIDKTNYTPDMSIILYINKYLDISNLNNCIKSIENQTCKDYELVIINEIEELDNSEILNKLLKNTNNNIVYIYHNNYKGFVESINEGIKYSNGKYISWILPNYTLNTSFIYLISQVYNTNKSDIIITSFQYNNIQIKSRLYDNESIMNEYSGIQSFALSKNIVNQIGDYIDSEHPDYDYFCKVFNIANIKVDFIREVLLDTTILLKDSPILCNNINFNTNDENKVNNINSINKINENNKNTKINTIEISNTSNISNINSTINGIKLTTENKHSIKKELIKKIKKFIDLSKDTLIYISNNISPNHIRQINILKNVSNYYNLVYTTTDNIELHIKDNILYLQFKLYCSLQKVINSNKIFILYNYPDEFLNIKKMDLKYDSLIFDLTEYSIKDYSILSDNLERKDYIDTQLYKSINNNNLLLYSSLNLKKIIDKLKCSKTPDLYISNCCNKNFMSNIIEYKKPIEFTNVNKKIVGYIGLISSSLDYNLIKTIADNNSIHVIMIGLLVNNPDYNLNFNHPNITWINYKNNDDIEKYLKYIDICMLPYKIEEKLNTINIHNPIKLYEYMKAEKPIISTVDFNKYENTIFNYNIIDKNNCHYIINELINQLNCEIEYKYNDIPYWDDQVVNIYNILQEEEFTFIKQLSNKLNKSCAFITEMYEYDNFNMIYGEKQKIALYFARLLKEQDIDVIFYQKASTEYETNYYEFKVKCYNSEKIENTFDEKFSEIINNIIIKDKIDFVIYGNPSLCCSNNILENSITINNGLWFNNNNIRYEKWNELFEIHLKRTMLTITSDYNFINYCRIHYPNYIKKIHYVPNFYNKDEIFIDNTLIDNKNNNKDKNKNIVEIIIPRHATINHGAMLIRNILNKIHQQNIHMTWIGYGDKICNDELNELTKIDKRFSFINCKYEEINKYYNNADIILLPSIANENLSIAGIESIVSNKIIIASNVGGLNNLIINNFNGILIYPDEISISQTLLKIINNKDKYNTLLNNSEKIINCYELNNWKQKIHKILKNIGWVYNIKCYNYKKNINKYALEISKNEIANNSNKYWKNYAHFNNNQKLWNDENLIIEHIELNKDFKNMTIFNNNMKIAIFTNTSKVCGISTIINEISKNIISDVYVYGENDNKTESFIYKSLYDEDDVTKCLSEHKYNAIIYFNIPDNIKNIIINTKIPTFYYIYNLDNSCINNLNVDILNNVEILTNSAFINNYIYKKYNKMAHIINYSVNHNKYKPMLKSNDNINKKKIKIGCLSIYNENKGIDIFLKAIKRCINKLTECDICIYGYCDNIEYKNKLIALSNTLNINCEFNDIIDPENYLNKLNLIVIPSKINELPLTLLESISCGIPIIVSDLIGVKEFNTISQLRNYNNLFKMFRTGDVNNLKNCLLEYLNNTDISDGEKMYKHEYIKKYYNTDIFNTQLTDIIYKYSKIY